MTLDPAHLPASMRPGMVLEILTPEHSVLATVVCAESGRVVALPEGEAPPAGRVLLRIPLDGVLVQASARLALPNRPDRVLVLDEFANLRRLERRCTQRLDEAVRARVATSDEGGRVLPAVNISERGLLLGWPDAPDVVLGEQVRLIIELGEDRVEATGEVVRTARCQSAIKFVEIGMHERDLITGYVFRRERARRLREDPYHGSSGTLGAKEGD